MTPPSEAPRSDDGRGDEGAGSDGLLDVEERARRWGGAAPPRRVRRCFAAALEHADDPAAAGEAAVSEGGERSLAAGLVGLAKGAEPRAVDPALSQLVEGLR